MHYETLWSFKTANFTIDWAIAPEEFPDLSWDETGETQERVANGDWSCFASRVRVTHNASGAELGCDYLGESVYADPREFRREHVGARGRWGAYFPDMVRNAILQARENMARLQSTPMHA